MRKFITFAVLAAMLCVASVAQAKTLRMGILPVLDTLPLQVAVKEGLFSQKGLDVELIPFTSAMERDTAMQAGRLDGYFGDMIATFLLIQSGVPMRMSTVSYRTTPGQTMFGLMAAPEADLSKKLNTGISKNSIMEYLLGHMSATGKAADLAFEATEIRKIPIRLQMLLSSQIGAALLPEPLVTLARAKGAKLLAVDSDLDMALTVLCLHEKVASQAEAFNAAYDEAVRRIAENPEEYRSLAAKTCRIPKPLVQSFPMYRYPESALPTEADVKPVQDWMLERGLLKKRLVYGAIVTY